MEGLKALILGKKRHGDLSPFGARLAGVGAAIEKQGAGLSQEPRLRETGLSSSNNAGQSA